MADLNTLVPGLVPWAKWIHKVGQDLDGRLVVTSARRSFAKQVELYWKWQKGYSKIPAAPPGKSLHQQGLAFDMARVGVDPLSDPLLAYLGYWWEHYGGKWGGERDPVHFQVNL